MKHTNNKSEQKSVEKPREH